MINRQFFFEQVRATLFTGKLTTKQVTGLTGILDEWEARHATWDDRWLAYALATTFHETAFTMQPIHERGGNDYFFRMYDKDSPVPARRAVAKRLGNTQPGDGVLFHGRGFVQLTGRANYTRMGTIFGVDLTTNSTAADAVLGLSMASRIMFKGMHEGLFTGARFATFFNDTKTDWVNARKIINGLDVADAIAQYGRKFYAALSHTT